MTPKLDNLEGKTALIFGGAGGVGEGLVRAFLAAGARVLVPSRSEAKLAELKRYVDDISTGELVTLIGSLDSEQAAKDLQHQVYGLGKHLDYVVASIGGWHQGHQLAETSLETWNQVMAENLTSHFLAIRYFVPLLEPQEGIYFHINGFGAESASPGAGPVAAMAAAQKSLAFTLHHELKNLGIRVYEFILGPIKTRQRMRFGQGKAEWYYPQEVGEYLVSLAQGTNEHYLDHVHRLMNK